MPRGYPALRRAAEPDYRDFRPVVPLPRNDNYPVKQIMKPGDTPANRGIFIPGDKVPGPGFGNKRPPDPFAPPVIPWQAIGGMLGDAILGDLGYGADYLDHLISPTKPMWRWPDFNTPPGNDGKWTLGAGPNDWTIYYPTINGGKRMDWSSDAFGWGTGPGNGVIAGQAITPFPGGQPVLAHNEDAIGLWYIYDTPAERGAQYLTIYHDIFGPNFDINAEIAASGIVIPTVASPMIVTPMPIPFPVIHQSVEPWGDPLTDPFGEPGGVPGSAPAITPGQNPAPYVTELPGWSPWMGDQPILGPNDPVVDPQYPVVPYSPVDLGGHNRKPPPWKTKEKKGRLRNLADLLGNVLGGWSEFGDLMDAAWQALPSKYRTPSYYRGHRIKPSWNKRWDDVYQHWDHVDLHKFFYNVLKGQLQDEIIGRTVGGADKALRKHLGGDPAPVSRNSLRGAPR